MVCSCYGCGHREEDMWTETEVLWQQQSGRSNIWDKHHGQPSTFLPQEEWDELFSTYL